MFVDRVHGWCIKGLRRRGRGCDRDMIYRGYKRGDT